MQINVNALEKSKSEDTQYVLCKDSETIICEYGADLLNYLKNGWDIAGNYHNGTAYQSYLITNAEEIRLLCNAIEKLIKVELDKINTLSLYFDESVDEEYKSDGIDVVISTFIDGKNADNFNLSNDNARVIHKIISDNGIKQYKHGIIVRLEKDLRRKK